MRISTIPGADTVAPDIATVPDRPVDGDNFHPVQSADRVTADIAAAFIILIAGIVEGTYSSSGPARTRVLFR